MSLPESLFRSILEISLSMAAVVALLLLLRPLLKKYYRATWMYWVWLLVAVRLVLPFNVSLPEAPVSLSSPGVTVYRLETARTDPGFHEYVLLTPENHRQAVAEEGADMAGGAEITGGYIQDQYSPVFTLTRLIALIWGGGATALLLWEACSYARFRRRVRRWRSEETDRGLLAQFGALKDELGVKKLALARCSAIFSPMVTGFFRPTLLLPGGAVPESVLRHELVHVKRRDLWYKLLLLFARAVHWFNPLVWLMVRQAGQDLEISCDEAVVENRSGDFRADYGRAILAAVDSGAGWERAPLTTYFHGGKRAMLERLQSIVNTKVRRRGLLALALAVVLTVAASAVCTVAPPTQRVDGGLYTLSIPTDVAGCTLTEAMPDEYFSSSYYKARFWRYSGTGSVYRQSIPGFADMSFEEQAEALQPPDAALGTFDFAPYTSPGGIKGILGKGGGGKYEFYSFFLGGDNILNLQIYLGGQTPEQPVTRFTRAEVDAILASLRLGALPSPAPKGGLTVTTDFTVNSAVWYLWGGPDRAPKLLDAVEVPAARRTVTMPIWSPDGKWAAVPASSEGGPRRDFQVLGVGPGGFQQNISTLFSLGGDPAGLFSSSGVTLDYEPVLDTLELQITEFVENPFPRANLPAVRVYYAWADTGGSLQSGAFTYSCQPLELSSIPAGYVPLADVEQNTPIVPTAWRDDTHTLSIPLLAGTAVGPDDQGVRTFTGPGGEYLGRISKVEQPRFNSQTYKVSTKTCFYYWLDQTDGLYYQLELCEADLQPNIAYRMAELLTMDGSSVAFYYQ